MDTMDGSLSDHFRMIVSGSSDVGKTTFIEKLLVNSNRLYPNDFDNIVYCYSVDTKNKTHLKDYFKDKIHFYNHIPDNVVELCSSKNHNILVLDDLDEEAFSSPIISQCFRIYAHHKNFCVILVTQDFYAKGSHRLTLIRNATHFILFPNFLDYTIPRLLAHRILPSKPNVFLNIYDSATNKPYGYLAVFGTGPKRLQFRTDITCPVQKVFLVE